VEEIPKWAGCYDVTYAISHQRDSEFCLCFNITILSKNDTTKDSYADMVVDMKICAKSEPTPVVPSVGGDGKVDMASDMKIGAKSGPAPVVRSVGGDK